MTPEQVLLLLTPTAHCSLSQHTPCSCKNRIPPSITQPVTVTQEKSLSAQTGPFILIPCEYMAASLPPLGTGSPSGLTGVPGPCLCSWAWHCLTQSRIPLPPTCAHLKISVNQWPPWLLSIKGTSSSVSIAPLPQGSQPGHSHSHQSEFFIPSSTHTKGKNPTAFPFIQCCDAMIL